MSTVTVPKTTFAPGVAHPFGRRGEEEQKTLKDRVFEKLQLTPEGLSLEGISADISIEKGRLLTTLLNAVDTKEVTCTVTPEGPIYKFVVKLPPAKFDLTTVVGRVEQFISEHPGVFMAQIVAVYPGMATKFAVAKLKHQGRCTVSGSRGKYQYYVP